MPARRRSGGMADAGDSKSPAPCGRVGSTPTSGTNNQKPLRALLLVTAVPGFSTRDRIGCGLPQVVRGQMHVPLRHGRRGVSEDRLHIERGPLLHHEGRCRAGSIRLRTDQGQGMNSWQSGMTQPRRWTLCCARHEVPDAQEAGRPSPRWCRSRRSRGFRPERDGAHMPPAP